MPLSLINKKIIISGGSSGIGWSTAKICLSRGAIVYICDIDSKSLKKAQKHPLNKKKLFTYECDASDEYEVSNFFIKIKKKTKKIDALINNVGIAGPTGNLEKLSSDDWEQTLKTNVISHFYFTKLAIPMLKKNKILWTFQDVKHDLWDFDISSPPILTELKFDDKYLEVVLATTKTGNTLVFDRKTGNSFYNINYKRAPKSNIPGEITSAYQIDNGPGKKKNIWCPQYKSCKLYKKNTSHQ